MKNLPLYQVTELPLYTIGRKTKLQTIKEQSVFQAAKYLRGRGYSLAQSLNLLTMKGV